MSGLVPEAFGHDPSATAVFASLPKLSTKNRSYHNIKAVVIGGGTGAPVSIKTLLSMGIDTSAVVAMADDGGSTGILRDQAGATTPGDIRKCITAMAADQKDALTQAFKVRFGFAENHTLGNLMLSALEVTSGSFPEAIKVCERLVDAQGHVYPSTLGRVSLVAKTRDGRTLIGQAVASHSRNALKKIALECDGPISAYQPACEHIQDANLIVLGPGSLYTSIISNLVVPGIIESIRASNATVVFLCSLTDSQGETRNMSVLDHYQALIDHGMKGLIDIIFAPHVKPQDEVENENADLHRLSITKEEVQAIREQGTKVLATNYSDAKLLSWHDPIKLRRAFQKVLKDVL